MLEWKSCGQLTGRYSEAGDTSGHRFRLSGRAARTGADHKLVLVTLIKLSSVWPTVHREGSARCEDQIVGRLVVGNHPPLDRKSRRDNGISTTNRRRAQGLSAAAVFCGS
ncbi:hypothetical protein [Levilactobacillus namurensis]|uniref:Uncharacterized protein n=1 Tax=Levilactobacillus namurensis TaxID=380393 RepID=A0AAW8W2D4_9LACO|nr:hypothetical protein [Levilactobacillus namurensis]MDT7013652.1 hypothetical protein [Levilactobacillus namurensis]